MPAAARPQQRQPGRGAASGATTVAAALSQPALEALAAARREALRHGVMFAGNEHLLLGLLATPSGAAAGVLAGAASGGLSHAAARERVDALHRAMPTGGLGGSEARDVEFGPDLRKIMTLASGGAGSGGDGGSGAPAAAAGTARLLALLLSEKPWSPGLKAALAGADAPALLAAARAADADADRKSVV